MWYSGWFLCSPWLASQEMTEVANLLRQASVVFQFFGGKLSFQRATVLQCTDSLRRLNTNNRTVVRGKEDEPSYGLFRRR